jgi:hypothetical protein
MRYAFIVMMAFIASIIILSAPSHAAPGSILEATAWNAAGGMIQKVDYWRHYYRPTHCIRSACEASAIVCHN